MQQANESLGDASGSPNMKYSYVPGLQLDGGMQCTLMTRSRLCSIPEGAGGGLLAAASDEMTRTVSVAYVALKFFVGTRV